MIETYLKKLNHIIPTFLIITFGTVIGLAFIRWILFIHFSIFDIKEEIWTLWIPLIFPWIPITLWLRPRFRVLTFNQEIDRRRLFFQVISWVVITAMLFISQSYLTTATGNLIHLSDIQEISKTEKTRYYKLANFSVAPYYGGSYTDFRTSGKYNQYLNFDIFFATPILSDTSEHIIGFPKYWYGVKFKKQISNKLSNSEKEEKYEAFYEECIQEMNNYNFHSLEYFERIPTSDDRQNYLKAIKARIKQTTNNGFIVLEPIKNKFENRNGNKLAWIFGSFGIGFAVLLLLLIWPGYSESERKKFLKGKKPRQDDLVDMFNYLIPKGNHFATSVIIDLNILVFLFMIFSGIHIIAPNGIELLEWGANRRLETTSGDWWRLLSSM